MNTFLVRFVYIHVEMPSFSSNAPDRILTHHLAGTALREGNASSLVVTQMLFALRVMPILALRATLIVTGILYRY